MLSMVNVTLDGATSVTNGLDPFAPYDYTPLGGSTISTINIQLGAAAVPEPATMALWGSGALGMGLVARRRAKEVATV
jgi:PEP-CTERM motif